MFSKPVKKGKVLFVALEDNPRRLYERINGLKRPDTPSIDLLFINNFREHFDTLDGFSGQQFINEIRIRNYDLVVIDTFSKSMMEDQLSSEDMTRVLSPLQYYAGSRDKYIVIIDHEPKYGDTPYGSVAKQAIVDTIWRLYQDFEKYGYFLSMVGRDLPKDQTLRLEKSVRSGRWKCIGVETDFKLTWQMKNVVTSLKRNGRSTGQEISDDIGEDRSNTHGKLQTLANHGVITRIGEGKDVTYVLNDSYPL